MGRHHVESLIPDPTMGGGVSPLTDLDLFSSSSSEGACWLVRDKTFEGATEGATLGAGGTLAGPCLDPGVSRHAALVLRFIPRWEYIKALGS